MVMMEANELTATVHTRVRCGVASGVGDDVDHPQRRR